MRRRKSKYHHRKVAVWGEDQKLQAVASYVMLGTLRETALATDIPYDTLRNWHLQPWWKELQLQIREEDVQKLDSNLQKVIGKALKGLEDRLDHGDYQYDPKTGKLLRIPIKAQIALRVTSDLLVRQEKLREASVRGQKKELEKTIEDRLLKLAEEFRAFAKAKTINAVAKSVEESVAESVVYVTETDKNNGQPVLEGA